MASFLRITYPGAFYHVTFRGTERKDIFKNKSNREKSLEYLCRDFIFRYFGKKASNAQKGYHDFVTVIVNKKL